MKTKITQNIKAIILGLVLTLGLSYVLADFTAPTFSPPNCPTTGPSANPACSTPINVGDSAQTKTGVLTLLNTIITGTFQLSGNGADSGKVLTSDATGVASWQSPASGGFNYVSNEYSVQSYDNGIVSVQMSPATTQYPFCFLTKHSLDTASGYVGSCEIIKNSGTGNWQLNANSTSNGTGATACKARCVGSNVTQTGPAVSCAITSASTLLPVGTLKNGEPYTFSATSLGGSYTYKFTGQSSNTSSNSYTSYSLIPGPLSPSVSVYDSSGLIAGTYSCGTATVAVATNGYFVMEKSGGNPGYASCPTTSISRSGTVASRTLRAVWPIGANVAGAQQDWYKQVAGNFGGPIGAGQTYIIPSSGGPETLIIKYVMNNSAFRGERTCTVDITN